MIKAILLLPMIITSWIIAVSILLMLAFFGLLSILTKEIWDKEQK